MRLAVIPARGGSKRIPRKNIRLFNGRPMIAWSIAAALESGCFDRVVVSTDDAQIAETARAFGAETPFARPAELADDNTPTIPVVAHAIAWFAAQGAAPAHACCVYATAPFVAPADIRKGLDLILAEKCDYAFSVTSFPSPIQRAFRIAANNRVEMFHPELFGARSQDLEPAYHDAAQFYWGRAQAWLQGEPIFGPRSAPVALPRWRVQDIDTEEDWRMAEFLFRAAELMRAEAPSSHQGAAQ